MAQIFISYRRSVSKHLARLIFQELRSRGHDVFLDVTTIDSGEFDRIILNQIAARPHFLLILSPGALERCVNEGDWLRREIEEAFRLKRNVVPIYDEGFNIDQEKQYLPKPLRAELPRLNAPPYSHYYFEAFIETVNTRFLKAPVYEVDITPTPAHERTEVQRRIEQAASVPVSPSIPAPVAPSPADATRRTLAVLAPPFEWVPIPAGKVTLGTYNTGGYIQEAKTVDVSAFAIAKYPVTNAQFRKFVDGAKGYTQKKWWTDAGWQVKEQAKWTQPRFWTDKQWNGDEYPVVGVSWYEAIAFCNWLTAMLNGRDTPLPEGEGQGVRVLLPTDPQWQRAAQALPDGGDSGYAYPWGNEWDGKKCNNSVRPEISDRTSPVTHYEKLGNVSPCGVVDLAGNVWEWCLTAYETGRDDLDGTDVRVQRGGSWINGSSSLFRADSHNGGDPDNWNGSRGFRVSRF